MSPEIADACRSLRTIGGLYEYVAFVIEYQNQDNNE